MLGGDAALDPDIEIGIIRSEELLVSLKEEYGRCLKDQRVSPRARQLTFEVLGLLRFTFDRLAYKYWDTYVAPDVLSEKREAARRNVSFPAADTEHKFRSALGKWGWQESRVQHVEFESFLLKRQPFFSEGNQWFEWLDSIVNKGKHSFTVTSSRKARKIHLNFISREWKADNIARCFCWVNCFARLKFRYHRTRNMGSVHADALSHGCA